MEERQQEIRKIWKDYASVYRIGGALFFVLIGVGIGWALFSQSDKQLDYLINLYSGGIQIVFTVLILDW